MSNELFESYPFLKQEKIIFAKICVMKQDWTQNSRYKGENLMIGFEPPCAKWGKKNSFETNENTYVNINTYSSE